MRNQLNKTFLGGVASACLVGVIGFSGAAYGVTADGTVGPTSTGTMDVIVNVPPLALVNELDTITLNYTTGDLVGSDEFCVWSSSGAYGITISSLNGTGAFQADSLTDSLAYTVVFDDTTNPATGVAVTEGALISGQVSTPEDGFPVGCGAGTTNAVVEVTFVEAANLLGADAGVYTDEMTLLVSPE
jgi:hypothetical protein